MRESFEMESWILAEAKIVFKKLYNISYQNILVDSQNHPLTWHPMSQGQLIQIFALQLEFVL